MGFTMRCLPIIIIITYIVSITFSILHFQKIVYNNVACMEQWFLYIKIYLVQKFIFTNYQ